MTNGEKYKTAKERTVAFVKFCKGHKSCSTCPMYQPELEINCRFIWLDHEAEEEKMTAKEVANILAEHNLWRRGEGVYAGQVGYPECWENQMDYEEIYELADRIETASKAYNKEVTELLKGVIEGVCLHCDMQSACAEGEDGMPTHCNAVAKAKHFIEQHSELDLDDECPF